MIRTDPSGMRTSIRSGSFHAVSRPPRSLDDEDPVGQSSCDLFSYAYLSLAFFLFICGSGLTFFVLKSEQTPNNPLNRYWMAGPLFICTGLLVALKVLLYVRRKRLIALLIREMTRDSNWGQQFQTPLNQSQAIIFDRSSLSSMVSLPPPYEVATHSSPPTYDEAIALSKSSSSPSPAVTARMTASAVNTQ